MAIDTSSDVSLWLLLAQLGLSPMRVRELLECFGSPRGIFEASKAELTAAAGGKGRLYNRVREVERSTDLAHIMRVLESASAQIIPLSDTRYPDLLKRIHAPPPVLFVVGDTACLNGPCVAIVGTRKASQYGKRVAEELATGLASNGVVVVSGLAVGIDAAAHQGALAANGKTAGVLGCSIEVWYPRANRELRSRIESSGAVVTEFAPGTGPTPWAFPQRNRIISGLSRGTIVVEAPEKSGALITAELALEQNREVMAVPGDVYSGRNRGCHALIRDGAALVESADDVLRTLSIPVAEPKAAAAAPAELSPPEQKVLHALAPEGVLIETVTEATGLSAADVASSLMLLEMKGHARRLAGGRYASVAASRS